MSLPKPHRFDTFARRMGASMIEAIRVTLLVFSSPDKDSWPQAKLLDYLKSAEEMARDMLREIAAKILITPATVRERTIQGALTPVVSVEDRAPYFRLGIMRDDRPSPVTEQNLPNTLGRSPEQSEPEGHTSNAQAQRPGEAGIAASNTDKRLSALQDVLQHPGKHAARMARALYRAEHETTGRLIAKSPNDRLLARVNAAIAAHLRGDGAEVARLHGQVMSFDTS